MTGILGGQWVLADFTPMENVPTGGRLTAFSGEAADISAAHTVKDVISAGGNIAIEVDSNWLSVRGCSPLAFG
jgi:NADPH:quinone reductase